MDDQQIAFLLSVLRAITKNGEMSASVSNVVDVAVAALVKEHVQFSGQATGLSREFGKMQNGVALTFWARLRRMARRTKLVSCRQHAPLLTSLRDWRAIRPPLRTSC